MKTLYIVRGLPGSGKSTFAKKLIDENPNSYKRISKDEGEETEEFIEREEEEGNWERGKEEGEGEGEEEVGSIVFSSAFFS